MEEPSNCDEGGPASEKSGEVSQTAAPDDSQEPNSAPVFVVSFAADVKTAVDGDQRTAEPQQPEEAPTEMYLYLQCMHKQTE